MDKLQENYFEALLPNKQTLEQNAHLRRCKLSGPLRVTVQSRSRTRLRIAAPVTLLFRAVLKGFRHYSTTIAQLSFPDGLERGGWELLPVPGCQIGRDGASQSYSLSWSSGWSRDNIAFDRLRGPLRVQGNFVLGLLEHQGGSGTFRQHQAFSDDKIGRAGSDRVRHFQIFSGPWIMILHEPTWLRMICFGLSHQETQIPTTRPVPLPKGQPCHVRSWVLITQEWKSLWPPTFG